MAETTFPPPPPSPRVASRSQPVARVYYWLGFVLGFALVGLLFLGGAAWLVGLTDLSLAELRGVGAAWTPPTPAAAPAEPLSAAAAPGVTECSTFCAGETVRNVNPSRINIRMTPGHLGKPAGDIIAQVDPGGTLEILGERAEQDNMVWWQVRVAEVEGWVAEATASGVQMLGR